MTLDLCATFHVPQYHGKEWPPSPSRFFAAVLAGARYRFRRGPAWGTIFDEAFRWLERQGAPLIVAPPANQDSTPEYVLFGKANAMDCVISGREKATDLNAAVSMHPWRITGPPAVHYLYEEDGAPVDVLRELVQSLTALGRGIDLAYGSVSTVPESESLTIPGVHWIPDPCGSCELYVPEPGWYERMEAHYVAWRKPPEKEIVDGRRGFLLPESKVLYRKRGDPDPVGLRPFLAYKLESTDGGHSFSLPWAEVMAVSARMRHAAATALSDSGEGFLRVYAQGHGRGSDRDRRLSYVPLPSVGDPNSDGRIRRVLFVGPRGEWDHKATKLRFLLERTPLEQAGRITARLSVLRAGERQSSGVMQLYAGRSRVWASVTPVILHGHDCRRGRVDTNRTVRLLREAFQQAGYGEVESFAYKQAPWWPGTGAAREIPVPKHLNQWPRYHAKVVFKNVVQGPILAGIGRHYGLGVFARSS